MKYMMLAIVAGFIIDCIVGDPVRLPHPVVLIGKGISFLEKKLRKAFPQTNKGLVAAGGTMALIIVLLSGALPFGILYLCFRINKWLFFALCCIMSWQIFAARCLQTEAMKVYTCLREKGLEPARRQVGMLVGRDTENLSEQQVVKAAVETVAENTSDGVIAPLFWMMLGGPVFGFMYKAINTMDSMVGYKNDKYLYFGRIPAKIDDIVNYIPARLSALGMIAAAAIAGFDGKNAARIWKRDRRKHASPNSAQTESVCAGALHVQLAGNAYYFGKLYEKPFIGDPDRAIEQEDIPRSCRLMYATSVFLLVIFELIGLAAVSLIEGRIWF